VTARERTEEETKAILDAQRRILRFIRNAAAASHGSLGISAAQLFVMQTLGEAPEALSVNELAARTYADQSTISVVAKKLEERGLVVRTRSAEDRRRVSIALTAKGRAVIRRNLASPQRGLLDGIRRLSPDARAGLAKHLPALLRAMALDHAPAPLMFDDDGRAARKGSRTRRTK